MKPQSFTPSSAKVVGMHKDSHLISKLKKPKIRIIHVFAPEVIKTDAANFRELVQNLTGNKQAHGDAESKHGGMMRKLKKTSSSAAGKSLKKMEEQMQNGYLIKEEIQDTWRGEKINTSFLDGFSDLEYGFIEDLNRIHSLPLSSSTSSMDVFEDPKEKPSRISFFHGY